MQHLAHGNLEALTQASLIFVLAIGLVILNLLVIATFVNFRGELFIVCDKLQSDFFFGDKSAELSADFVRFQTETFRANF